LDRFWFLFLKLRPARRAWESVAAGDSLEVKLMGSSVCCAGMLVLSADKEKLISEILKCLFSKNNDPWIFEENW